MKTRFTGLIPFAFMLCAFLTSLTISASPTFPGDTSLTLYKNDHTGQKYLRLNEINIHAMRDFVKRFKSVTDDKWLKVDGGYLTRFTVEEKKSDAYYDDMGRFIAASSYYSQENSPADLKDLIEKEYPGYGIIAATKITIPEKTFYRLHISNPEFVKTLQVVNTRIHVLETLQNGSSN